MVDRGIQGFPCLVCGSCWRESGECLRPGVGSVMISAVKEVYLLDKSKALAMLCRHSLQQAALSLSEPLQTCKTKCSRKNSVLFPQLEQGRG